jgi:hypothetical protein
VRSDPATPHPLPPGQASPPRPPAPRAAPQAAYGRISPPAPPGPPVLNRPDEPLVRPYVITGGRTRPEHEFAIEALTLTTDKGRALAGGLVGEQAAICRMCEAARSIAEVSALLNVPLGVARVLIDDMSRQGLVSVITPRQQDSHSAEVLMSVLEGLRRL